MVNPNIAADAETNNASYVHGQRKLVLAIYNGNPGMIYIIQDERDTTMFKFTDALSKIGSAQVRAHEVTGVTVSGATPEEAVVKFWDAKKNSYKNVIYHGGCIVVASSIPAGNYKDYVHNSVLPDENPLPNANNYCRFALNVTNKPYSTVKFIPTNSTGSTTSDAGRINEMFEAAWVKHFGGGVPLKGRNRYDTFNGGCEMTENLVQISEKNLLEKYKTDHKDSLAEYNKLIKEYLDNDKYAQDFFTPKGRWHRILLVSMCENPDIIKDIQSLLPNEAAFSRFCATVLPVISKAYAKVDSPKDVIIRIPKNFVDLKNNRISGAELLRLEKTQGLGVGWECMIIMGMKSLVSDKGISVSYTIEKLVIDTSKQMRMEIGVQKLELGEETEESRKRAEDLIGGWDDTPALCGRLERKAITNGDIGDNPLTDEQEKALADAEAAALSAASAAGLAAAASAAASGEPPEKKLKTDGDA